MMKCRGMGAAMRKMGGGSMKPVAMKEGKMVERKQRGQSINQISPSERANMAASMERRAGTMADRRAYGKMVKRKMKGKSC